MAVASQPRTDYRLGFTTLDRETTLAAVPLTGALPPWLRGTLLRNGPARFEVGGETYAHWFDGLAMIHRFAIADGEVAYANRFLRTPAYLAAERTGRIAAPEFATEPRRSIASTVGSLFGGGHASDNANVTIVPHGDGYLALTETPSPVAFDGETLATRGVLAYDDDVPCRLSTAHTQYDPERRATFNVVTQLGRTSAYHVVRIADGTLTRTIVASIPVDKPAYLHAFATTERYVIVVEYPLVVVPLDLKLRRRPYIDNYRWQPERGTRFHVVHKDGGARAGTYETDAFFAFHAINAYDDGDTAVVDLSAYDDARVIDDFRMARVLADGAAGPAAPSFRRFRLVPGTAAARVETIAPAATELPATARRRAARPYRYAYGVDGSPGTPWAAFDALVKVDAGDGGVTRWAPADGYPGEPVFVERPDAIDEDDGVLLSVVLDARAGTSFLAVLDARSMTEIARATLPHHVPFGFHGLFR